MDDGDDDLMSELRDLAAKYDPPPPGMLQKVKEVFPKVGALDTADPWWVEEVARAKRQWEEAKTLPHTGVDGEEVCYVCVAGDGDARCQRCGCSVGHPGCQCPEGYLAGPCMEQRP